MRQEKVDRSTFLSHRQYDPTTYLKDLPLKLFVPNQKWATKMQSNQKTGVTISTWDPTSRGLPIQRPKGDFRSGNC